MGILDEALGDLSVDLVDIFVDEVSLFQRVTQVFDEDTNTDVVSVLSSATAKVTPPQPFSYKLIDGNMILVQDVFAYVPARTLSDQSFDMIPTSNVHLMVTLPSGRKYRAMRVEPISPGDTNAMYGLHLRP